MSDQRDLRVTRTCSCLPACLTLAAAACPHWPACLALYSHMAGKIGVQCERTLRLEAEKPHPASSGSSSGSAPPPLAGNPHPGLTPSTLHPPPCARWPGTIGPWLAGHCLWVLVWTGACYRHGVGGSVFNSSSSSTWKYINKEKKKSGRTPRTPDTASTPRAPETGDPPPPEQPARRRRRIVLSKPANAVPLASARQHP